MIQIDLTPGSSRPSDSRAGRAAHQRRPWALHQPRHADRPTGPSRVTAGKRPNRGAAAGGGRELHWTLRVKPLQVGTWTLTSPNFSYQDPQGRTRRIPDLRLDIQVVPADPAVGPRPSAVPEPDQQVSAPQGIFISYRRDETGLAAVHLADRLHQRFDRSQVFRDLDSIGLGVDFRKAIGDALQSCAVALVLIGPTWARMTDEQGRQRLDDPGDFVRVEVETVLGRHLPVIPVLVGGASMPRPEVLPDRLEQLVYRQAAQLRDESLKQFELDLENLVEKVAGLVPAQG